MKTKPLLQMVLMLMVVAVLAGLFAARYGVAPQRAETTPLPDSRRREPAPIPARTPVWEQNSPQATAPAPRQPVSGPVRPAIPDTGIQPAAAPEQDPRFNDPAFKEQVGRFALSAVGDDPDAEDAWIQVINDPSLSAEARQNLIEDLNEDGLSDPQNPSLADLPLILNRIQLIEELVPDAMDQVNWDALQEAYKDLVNMAARLSRPQ